MVKNIILANLNIHTENKILVNAALIIQDKQIFAIEKSSAALKKYHPAEVIEFPENYHLVPGFIDMHIHGANGSDVMDGDLTALINMSETLAQEGTTGFLATTMTASVGEIEKALRNIADFVKIQNDVLGAKILGVHLEGPFLSPEKVGAQRADQILPPKKAYIQNWQSICDNNIKLVTLAPELPGSLPFIQYLVENNIIAAIGHTDATYEESNAAIAAGCTHATHLFNAMRGLHQREPGVVTAALLSPDIFAELILDGNHLHSAVVKLAFKLKGVEKIVLVTDSMRAKCLEDGTYDLGGQAVIVNKNRATLKNGTLAGSVLKMHSAFQNLLEFTGCSMNDAIKMTSANPAKALGIFSKTGSIAVNKAADLVVLDDKLNVVFTMREGKNIFSVHS